MKEPDFTSERREEIGANRKANRSKAVMRAVIIIVTNALIAVSAHPETWTQMLTKVPRATQSTIKRAVLG